METSLTIYFELPLKLRRDMDRVKRIFISHGSEYHSEPHVTLYTARFGKTNFKKLFNKINKINLKKFIFTVASIERKIKFFRVNIKKTREIANIHKQILGLAGPLCNKKLRLNDTKRLQEGRFSKKELQLLHKYGTAMALEYFSPHITLGGVSLDVSESKLKELYKISKMALSHTKGEEYSVDKIILIFKKRLKSGQKKIVFKKNIYLD